MTTSSLADRSPDTATLEVLLGRWTMRASFETGGAPPPAAETTFEWLLGQRFLIQRWQVDHPDAPDGVAIIGYDDERATFLQHYFDSRGVARVYDMSLADGWRLERRAPAPDFSQRFTGEFSADGDTITGRWEIAHGDGGWEHDFDVTYTRVRP